MSKCWLLLCSEPEDDSQLFLSISLLNLYFLLEFQGAHSSPELGKTAVKFLAQKAASAPKDRIVHRRIRS